MECEMCGKKVGTRRYMVEGTVMNLGLECSKYGTPLDAPAPVGTQASMQQGLERREQRMTSRNVYDGGDQSVMVEDFGPRIHKAREAKGLSHEQLGNKVSARVPELKHIEAGKLRPSDAVAKKLERELGITLFEKVEGPAPVVSGVAKKAAAGGSGLTIGDLLKDAIDKKKAGAPGAAPSRSNAAIASDKKASKK
ncbi:MAG TPA: multiprotein bridging factor aMBF1 [Candidatus Thermoplasmatota archaeon]|nr:multiprotein bridging factor aMBF1 [Candidatus Thermoplasmatota archaeon]